MGKKIIFAAALIIMLMNLCSCTMHTVPGISKRGWSMNGSSRHYGTGRNHNNKSAFWGRHKYGNRPNYYRGRYRQRCGL